MIFSVLAQQGFDSIGVLKVLAVAGGAGLGGLIVGLLSQFLSRSLTAQKLPPKLLHGSRLGGAGIGGWLVALWVFGGGGTGLGGGGGFGVGPGEGTGPDNSPPGVTKDANNDKHEPPPPPPGGGGTESLRVEVLGKGTLTKITGGAGADLDRCYRVEGKEGQRLLTLAEAKDLVRERQKQTPPLRRVEIVLYNDSPARDVPFVTRLSHWAREQDGADGEKLRVDFSSPDANAPTR
jgi:hypothetical protein